MLGRVRISASEFGHRQRINAMEKTAYGTTAFNTPAVITSPS